MALLELKNVEKIFYNKNQPMQAVDHVSFQIEKGECFGIVGESGCGKSTLVKMITRLQDVSQGKIVFESKEIQNDKGKDLKNLYKQIQMVFQNPQNSFDPRKTLSYSMMEGLLNQGISKEKAKKKIQKLCQLVGLEEELLSRYPFEVSGGQCQRAAFIRALAISPKLLILDEATSALDVTVQAQIITLIKQLKEETDITILFICHDLALVQNLCDRVAVMHKGQIVEQGNTDEVIMYPQNEYIKSLIDAAL